MIEAVGFWIMVAGTMLLVISCYMYMCTTDECFSNTYMALMLAFLLAGLLLAAMGFHIMSIGNQGHYPPYPFN